MLNHHFRDFIQPAYKNSGFEATPSVPIVVQYNSRHNGGSCDDPLDVFLINFDRMYMVGRTFGNVKEGGRESNSTNTLNCHIRFAAFANPVTFPACFLEAENPG